MHSSKKSPVILLVACLIILLLTTTTVYALNGFATKRITSDGSTSRNEFSSMVLDANGYPVIAYSKMNGMILIICHDAECDTFTRQILGSGFKFYPSIQLNRHGFPVIAYTDDSKVRLITCQDANCATRRDSMIDSSSFASYTSLVLDSGDIPRVSYYGDARDLIVGICASQDCSAFRGSFNIDTIFWDGKYSDIDLLPGDIPVISYYEEYFGDLKIAICGNTECSSGNTIRIIDSAGNVGQYTSLAVNASGIPVISYYDVDNADLKLLVCGDPTCSSGNTITTVDSAGDVGKNNSLALDANGFPVISYHDATNNAIKVVRCADAACSSGVSPTLIDSLPGAYYDIGASSSVQVNGSDHAVVGYYRDQYYLAWEDSTGPRVAQTDPQDGAHLLDPPLWFMVEFDENVLHTSAEEADNFILLEAQDGTFESGTCDDILNGPGAARTDTRIFVQAAIHDERYEPWISWLTFDPMLAGGKYRLMVCGTTSVEDTANNSLNDGAADTIIEFSIAGDPATIPDTGFSPNAAAALPVQSLGQAYQDTSIVLSIPILAVEADIVAVPRTDKSWDVTWLGENIGYLSGSAFPTWEGNTVLTGHVWNAFNQPGVFSGLKKLQYGDLVEIQAWDQTYTYQVQDSRLVFKNQLERVFQPEDLDWITLVTCELYDPFSDSYLFRRVVRAVLVDVE